jgi:poly(A) RNA polymerase GLD2
MLFIEYSFNLLQSRFPQYGLFMVGSTLNGFGSNVSDVDMCLLVRDTAVDQRSEAIYRLGQIMSCLRRSGL